MSPAARAPMQAARLLVAFALLATLLVGCRDDDKDKPTPTNTEQPQWVVRSDPPRKVAVVFIHGLFGSTTGTWGNKNGPSFLNLLKNDPEIGPKVDIFAFGFTSTMFRGGSLNVMEAANVLDQTLTARRVWDYDSVVLVGHSMGGLIAMRMLIRHRQRLAKVPLLVLYSSPQAGSQVASLARHIANNDALRQLVPADGNDFLLGIDDDWSSLEQEAPSVACAYEKKGVAGLMIVERSSATRYCGSVRIAIGGSDHLSIVKPTSRQDPAYEFLSTNLEKYVLGRDTAPLLEMPDFANDGGSLVYTLGDPEAEGVARVRNAGSRALNFTIVPPANPKLMVWPAETPKRISAGDTQQLRFALRLGGRADPEYTFQLKAPAMPDRQIVVRVPGHAVGATIQPQRVQDIRASVDTFLASPDNIAQLNALPAEQQRARIAEVARDAVFRDSPDTPVEMRWAMTADALSSIGWPDLANAALHSAERASPALVKTPSVQAVATAIRVQSGERVSRSMPEAHAPPPANEPATAPPRTPTDTTGIGRRNLADWQRLSQRMQQVSGLRSEGKTLQGDVLREQGDLAAAEVAFRDADRIKSSPVVRNRIQTTRELRAAQPR